MKKVKFERESASTAAWLLFLMSHRTEVAHVIGTIRDVLLGRMIGHDRSKETEDEAPVFEQLHRETYGANVDYGSKHWDEAKKRASEGLQLHKFRNQHHAEHFKNGINGMTLPDLIEMFADWKVCSKEDGESSIFESLHDRCRKHGCSSQLESILANTARMLEGVGKEQAKGDPK